MTARVRLHCNIIVHQYKMHFDGIGDSQLKKKCVSDKNCVYTYVGVCVCVSQFLLFSFACAISVANSLHAS